ncbi:MAG: hypothetical protein RIG27_06050 [Coleofasciculus sp. F4-SAH-05]
MGQAGKALKKVLETYEISQYRLAAELGIGRSNVYRWLTLPLFLKGGFCGTHIPHILRKQF